MTWRGSRYLFPLWCHKCPVYRCVFWHRQWVDFIHFTDMLEMQTVKILVYAVLAFVVCPVGPVMKFQKLLLLNETCKADELFSPLYSCLISVSFCFSISNQVWLGIICVWSLQTWVIVTFTGCALAQPRFEHQRAPTSQQRSHVCISICKRREKKIFLDGGQTVWAVLAQLPEETLNGTSAENVWSKARSH